ncbi:MAG: NupC/NupG family nucleoside CNT transporter [Candidatus Aureabacteria bacterium]|nr:NupC/NupG family nucleoside CNT transporter [Candidatus Auribacterota bacterium]
MYKFISLIGTLVILGIAYLMSNNKRRVSVRIVLWGTALQVIFAFLVIPNSPLNQFVKNAFGLPVAPGEAFFNAMNDAIIKLLSFTTDGAKFLFGNLVNNNVPLGMGESGSNMPVKEISGYVATTGAYFAFSVLPTIIFFSSLMTVLYHLGIMQRVVAFIAWIMERCLRTSGAETLSASANIFLGQTEAPLCVKPFIEEMTNSEIMCVMCAGFATVAGGVMAAYVGMLKDYFPDIAGHLLTASIMSAPAAIVMAKLIFPEVEIPKTRGGVKIHLPKTNANIIDAAANGAASGMQLALNVACMLLAFIALVSMCNFGIHLFGVLCNKLFATNWDLSLQYLLSLLFAPFTWVMGVPWKDCMVVGRLMGERLAINEFVAYLDLASLTAQGVKIDHRSYVIATYALCGFANFSSIAIQIGGIGGMAPSRRHDLARLGLKAMFGGVLASCMTGTIAGMFV